MPPGSAAPRLGVGASAAPPPAGLGVEASLPVAAPCGPMRVGHCSLGIIAAVLPLVVLHRPEPAANARTMTTCGMAAAAGGIGGS